MNNIFYSNKEKFEKLKKKFISDSIHKIHILADFDSTLTKAFDNWKKIPWIFQIIVEHNLLWDDYSRNWKMLFEKYYPLEINPNISIEDKKKFMQEWWENVFESLLKYWYNLEHVNYIWSNPYTKLRDWYDIFFNIISKTNIPLIVMSAAGVWSNTIEKFFEYNLDNTDNIKVISNVFEWDKKWKMIWYKKPLIHSFNKSEVLLENYPDIHNLVEKRRNVILLWDSLWDHHMIDWFSCDNLLKIWYLNFNEDNLLEEYLKRYDVVITWDGDMSFINEFLNEC